MFETHKAFVTFKAHVDQLRLAVEHFISTNKKETAEEWLLELMFLQESFENVKNRKATIGIWAFFELNVQKCPKISHIKS